MSTPHEFLIEDVETETPDQPEVKAPWYKSLPQANLRPEGKVAARLTLGAAKLHPIALGLDLASFLADQGLKFGGTKKGQEFRKYLPTSQDIINPAKHLLGLEENPQGAERIAENLGEYAQLARGRGVAPRVAKTLGLAAGEEAVGGVLGEDARLAYKVVAPLAVKGGEPLATGRQASGRSTLSVAVENNPELNELYNYGRSIGMSDAELAPILTPDWKTRLFGRFSRNTNRLRNNIDQAREQLGRNYNRLRAEGRAGLINPRAQETLFNEIADMHTDILRTNVIGPDNQAILNTLEEAMQRMHTQPQTVETLINSYQNINSIPNWGAANDGRRRLLAVNRHFQNAIANHSPATAREFALTNRMYARQADFSRNIGLRRNAEDILTVAETAGLLSGVAYGAVTGDYGNAAKIIGLSAARRIGTQLLTNPRFQGIHRNMMTALSSGDQTALANSFNKFLEFLKKEDPDAYKAMIAPEFIIED